MKRYHTCLPNRQINLLFAVFVTFVVLTYPASAQRVIYVDDDAPMGGDGLSWDTAYRFLQDAIAKANTLSPERTEIRVAQGLYKPDQNEANPDGTRDREMSFTLTGDMSLRGGYLGHKFSGLGTTDPDAQDPNLYPTILSGDLADNDVDVNDLSMLMDEPSHAENAFHVLVMSGWVLPRGANYNQEEFWSSASFIEGLVITGGYALDPYDEDEFIQGGGVVLTSYSKVIKNCLIETNVADKGGGLYLNDSARARLMSCRFSKNTANIGGGVYCAGSHLIGAQADLMECEFTENWANYWAGGLYSSILSEITFTQCQLTDNVAMYNGGGIYNDGSSHVELVDTELKRNCALLDDGGAIAASGLDSLVLTRCALTGNYSEKGGGAIFVIGTVTGLINCLFTGNSSYYGGVLSYTQSQIYIMNCTGHANRAEFGRFMSDYFQESDWDGHVLIKNCILNNGGNEIWIRSEPEERSIVEFRYSNIPDEIALTQDPTYNWIFWGPGNLCVDPCFVEPGFWNTNNTPDDSSDDVYKSGDYHLKSQAGHWDSGTQTWVQDGVTSPCIDAGDPLALLGDEVFPHGDRINMGVYGGTVEASLSHPQDLPGEPNVPEPPGEPNVPVPPDDSNDGGSTGGGGGR